MIGKHVDVIAIALLLAAAALYTEARNLSLLQVVRNQRLELTQTVQRAMKCSRSLKAQRAAGISRELAAPHVFITSE